MDNDDLITPHEAAAIVKRTTQTLTAWRKHGKYLKFKTIGGRIFYSRRECKALVKNGVPGEPARPGIDAGGSGGPGDSGASSGGCDGGGSGAAGIEGGGGLGGGKP